MLKVANIERGCLFARGEKTWADGGVLIETPNGLRARSDPVGSRSSRRKQSQVLDESCELGLARSEVVMERNRHGVPCHGNGASYYSLQP